MARNKSLEVIVIGISFENSGEIWTKKPVSLRYIRDKIAIRKHLGLRIKLEIIEGNRDKCGENLQKSLKNSGFMG